MTVQWIGPGESLGARRGDVVVCIPVSGAHERLLECLNRVLENTPAGVPILICDDASPGVRSQEFDGALSDALSAQGTRELGRCANLNAAFAAAAPGDVVVLEPDCMVAQDWLPGLRDAAYVDSNVATATALTNNGTVPELEVPPADFESAAAAVRARSLRLRPRLATAAGHCMYVRRSALELVGNFDLASAPRHGEEANFSQRCLQVGLSHVLADDVLVLHQGGAKLPVNGSPDPVELPGSGSSAPLARSLSAARRALRPLSVMIDARILRGPMTGTQLHVLELLAALARSGEVRVRVALPEDLSPYAKRALEELPQVEPMSAADALALAPSARADVVHRPFQVAAPADLTFLAQLGDRLMITQQDMIGYRNPAYFDSVARWEGYRDLTRRALSLVDRVVFFSAHARDEAVAEGLVEPSRASVVHIGVDHALVAADEPPGAPSAAAGLPPDAEVMVCLGTDLRHKNRIFAMRMLEELRARHGWPGWLVLAGPRVARGSSRPDEQRWLAQHPESARSVLDVGAVTEAEKTWLLGRANLVVYPTVYEGFGLVPFEAAGHEVPCLWAGGTSLSEVLPDSAAGIVSWDVAASAERALELLREPQAREANVEAVRRAGEHYRWDATADELIQIYQSVCDSAPTPAGAAERMDGIMSGGMSPDAIRLLGPEGALSRDLERPLLALASHPQIGQPIFRVIKAGYRASLRLRLLSGRQSRAE